MRMRRIRLIPLAAACLLMASCASSERAGHALDGGGRHWPRRHCMMHQDGRDQFTNVQFQALGARHTLVKANDSAQQFAYQPLDTVSEHSVQIEKDQPFGGPFLYKVRVSFNKSQKPLEFEVLTGPRRVGLGGLASLKSSQPVVVPMNGYTIVSGDIPVTKTGTSTSTSLGSVAVFAVVIAPDTTDIGVPGVLERIYNLYDPSGSNAGQRAVSVRHCESGGDEREYTVKVGQYIDLKGAGADGPHTIDSNDDLYERIRADASDPNPGINLAP